MIITILNVCFQREIYKLKAEKVKVEQRMEEQRKQVEEAYAFAKQQQEAKVKADEVHAKWELQLRETLKERDKDLIKLNYESRLLQHRGNAIICACVCVCVCVCVSSMHPVYVYILVHACMHV
jgi:hypothetical protein